MTIADMPMLLARITADQRRAGEHVRRPATEAAIETLAVRTQSGFGLALPPEYAAFLRLSDGLAYDGFTLYDCTSTLDLPAYPHAQGLIDANHVWRDVPRPPGLLFLGDTDMDLVAVDAQGLFLTLDRVSDDITNQHHSFAALFGAIMASRS